MNLIQEVVDLEPTMLNWVTFRDTAGNLWRYVRQENRADLDTPAHAKGVCQDAGAIAFIFLPGFPLGVPDRFVLDYPRREPGSYTQDGSEWRSRMEYIREKA